MVLPTDMRSLRRRRCGSSVGLSALLAGLAACVDGGQSASFDLGDAVIAFAVEHDGQSISQVARIGPSADFRTGVAAIRAGRELAIVTLSVERLKAIHPAFDVARTSEVDLSTSPLAESCTRVLEDDGSAVRVPLPGDVASFRPSPEDGSTFQMRSLPEEIIKKLYLRVPLGSCGLELEVRDFALGAYALETPFEYDGLRDAGSARPEDLEFFTVVDAAYLAPEVALVAMYHGLLIVPRGERVNSAEATTYFSQQALPAQGPADTWRFRSVVVRPATVDTPLRVFTVATRVNRSAGIFETMGALLRLDGDRLSVLSSTVTAGKGGRASLALDGRFFVPMSDGDEDRREYVLIADPDALGAPYRVLHHDRPVKQLGATSSPSAPHVVLTHGMSRLQVGDIVERAFLIDETVPLGAVGLRRVGHAVTTFDEPANLQVLVSGEDGGLEVRGSSGAWSSLTEHFDTEFRQSGCISAVDACGGFTGPPELAELTVLPPTGAPPIFLSLPRLCPHVLGSMPSGCTGLIEIEPPFALENPRMLTVLRPAPDGEHALLGGRGGLLMELSLK